MAEYEITVKRSEYNPYVVNAYMGETRVGVMERGFITIHNEKLTRILNTSFIEVEACTIHDRLKNFDLEEYRKACDLHYEATHSM